MSTSLKLMLPLTKYPITMDMVSEETGFINAFTYDMNNPWLENRIFLMYEFDMSTRKKAIRFEKMKRLGLCSNIYKIKNKLYQIYTLPYTNEDLITSERIGYMCIDEPDSKYKILSFWKNTQDDVTDFILGTKKQQKFDKTSVPEKDYDEKEKDGLTIKKVGVS